MIFETGASRLEITICDIKCHLALKIATKVTPDGAKYIDAILNNTRRLLAFLLGNQDE